MRHFRTNIWSFCWIFKSACTFLICWYLVSVWPIVGQYVLCTGENFSREYSGWFVRFVGNFWSEKYLQNYCLLALKIGTGHADLSRGSALHVWVIPLGGDTLYFIPVRRCLFLIIENYSALQN